MNRVTIQSLRLSDGGIRAQLVYYVGHIDEDVEEDEDDLTRAGKAIKKLMRKNDQDGVYDSDEEKNPYASSVSIR